MRTAHGVGFWLSQIGRDRALRSAPLWIVVTALNTSVLMGVIALRNARQESAVFPTRELTLVLGLALAVYLLAAGVRDRCRRIDMTLPLSTRNLWTVHSVATLLAGFLIIVASAGVLAVHLSILSSAAAFSAGTDVLVGLCAHLAAIWFLAVMVMQSYRTDLKKPTGRRAILISLTTAVGILAFAAFLGEHSLAIATVATAVSMILGYRTLHGLPKTFSLWPLEVSDQNTTGAIEVPTQRSESQQPAAGVPSRLTSRTLIARTLFHTPRGGRRLDGSRSYPSLAWDFS